MARRSLRACRTDVPADDEVFLGSVRRKARLRSRGLWTSTRSVATRLSEQPLLAVRRRYYVAYHDANDSTQNLRSGLLWAQHHQSLVSGTATNRDLERLPSSGFWKFTAGSANVVPVPADFRQLRFVRLSVGESATGTSDYDVVYCPLLDTVPWADTNQSTSPLTYYYAALLAAFPDLPLTASTHQHVIVAPLGDSVLGQAVFVGNYLVADSQTVGGPALAGLRAQYNRGKTVDHEAGHNWGLPHTFPSDAQCPDSNVIGDLVPQKLPNYDFQLVQTGGGQWTGANGNRSADCQSMAAVGGGTWVEANDATQADAAAFPRGCHTCPSVAVSVSGCTMCQTEGQGEAGYSYMDYSEDDALVAFSPLQCAEIRAVLTENVDWRDTSVEATLTRSDVELIANAGYDLSDFDDPVIYKLDGSVSTEVAGATSTANASTNIGFGKRWAWYWYALLSLAVVLAAAMLVVVLRWRVT